MVVNNSLYEFGEIPLGLISNLGQIALWIQGLGLVLLIWLIFQVISLYLNRKKMKEIYSIKQDVKRIEGKIDKIFKKLRK